MSVCHSLHVPRDADVVLVEYTVNDPAHLPPPPFANDHRAAYERLLRKLLQYPRRPAVVLLHAYSYLMVKDHAYWKNAESEFHEFATYYHLPELSLKVCSLIILVPHSAP